MLQIAACVLLCVVAATEAVSPQTKYKHGDGLLPELIKRIEVLEARDRLHSEQELRYQQELDQQKQTVALLQAENADQQRQIRELQDAVNGQHVDGEAPVSEVYETGRVNRGVSHDILPRHSAGRSVAFFAKLEANPVHLAANDTIIFETAETNVGNCYDTTTGFFMAPVGGTYFFSTTITTFSVFNSDSGFAKNHHRITEVWINGKQNAFASNGQSIIIRLNPGDVMSVQQAGSETYLEGQGHSLFSGFLIFEDPFLMPS